MYRNHFDRKTCNHRESYASEILINFFEVVFSAELAEIERSLLEMKAEIMDILPMKRTLRNCVRKTTTEFFCFLCWQN